MSSELEKPPTPYSTKTKPNRTLPRPFHTCNTSILDAYYTTRDRLEILAQESLNWSLDSGSKTERRIVMETSSRSFLHSTLNTSLRDSIGTYGCTNRCMETLPVPIHQINTIISRDETHLVFSGSRRKDDPSPLFQQTSSASSPVVGTAEADHVVCLSPQTEPH